MSELKIVSDASEQSQGDGVRSGLPVPASDAAFTRRDLDLIKRDLIVVRKDYNEIRNTMVILTHQHSSAPSRSFFIGLGLLWLVLLMALLTFQPELASWGSRALAHLPHR